MKGETLVTAPDGLVLNGITRKHILNICRQNLVKLELRCINVKEISEYDAVFMTGTSPMVLPFCLVDDISFNVELPLMKKLRDLYILKAEESIRLFRHE